MKKFFLVFFTVCMLAFFFPELCPAQETEPDTGIPGFPYIDLNVREAKTNKEVALSIQLLILLSVLTIAPSIVILMTSFLRIAIVFDFIKRSLSLQQVPPTQVLMGIALFLTLFIMWPTFTAMYENAFKPFSEEKIGIEDLYKNAESPLRIFMFRQLDNNYDNIRLFMNMQNLPKPKTDKDVPTYILIPAFVLNELTIAFKIGIFLFLPFIIIDMVVASTLMSMGMIMLPPVMISMPFKLILFVLINGWDLIVRKLIETFL
ncbi:MAG: flagellar type III secretion system pore protein FliP [Spirochaetales bacterium]|nr:flagellar type III secretion system pore protein FliP [Spirochaetales bacterium]